MTDTADYADLVLPATSQLEHTDLHKSYGHTLLTYNGPAIAPLGECKSNWEVMGLTRGRPRLRRTLAAPDGRRGDRRGVDRDGQEESVSARHHAGAPEARRAHLAGRRHRASLRRRPFPDAQRQGAISYAPKWLPRGSIRCRRSLTARTMADGPRRPVRCGSCLPPRTISSVVASPANRACSEVPASRPSDSPGRRGRARHPHRRLGDGRERPRLVSREGRGHGRRSPWRGGGTQGTLGQAERWPQRQLDDIRRAGRRGRGRARFTAIACGCGAIACPSRKRKRRPSQAVAYASGSDKRDDEAVADASGSERGVTPPRNWRGSRRSPCAAGARRLAAS